MVSSAKSPPVGPDVGTLEGLMAVMNSANERLSSMPTKVDLKKEVNDCKKEVMTKMKCDIGAIADRVARLEANSRKISTSKSPLETGDKGQGFDGASPSKRTPDQQGKSVRDKAFDFESSILRGAGAAAAAARKKLEGQSAKKPSVVTDIIVQTKETGKNDRDVTCSPGHSRKSKRLEHQSRWRR